MMRSVAFRSATVEVPDELFIGLTCAAAALYGFEIDVRHFAILGHCADCRKGPTT